MKKHVLALLVALGVGAGAAHAASPVGPYVGAGLGLAAYHAAENLDLDHHGMGFDLYGGYRFNETFAAEVSHARLGKMRISTPDGSALTRNTVTSVSGLAYLPLNETLSLYGRAGLAHTRVSAHADKLHETNAILGLGAEFKVNRSLAIRAEVQFLPHLGDSKMEAAYVTTGLKYSF